MHFSRPDWLVRTHLKKKSMSFARLWRVWSREQGRPGSIWGRWTGPGTPETSILGGPEPRFSFRFSIVLPFEFAFDFSIIFRSSLQLMPCRSWIDETSPNPDFVRPVEVFQGFFDIAHPCRHDESVVERSTIIQKSFEKIDRIFIEKSIRNRRNIGAAPKLREKRIRTRHGGAPGRPGSAPERARSPSGASWEGPGGTPGRPESVRERSRSVLGASRERPQSPQIAPKGPKSDFASIFHRFGVDFGVDFRWFLR